MKTKLYEDKYIIIYTKGDLEVGQEAEVADSLFTQAMIGYKTMATHLKEPQKFLDEVWFGIEQCFEELREQFKNM